MPQSQNQIDTKLTPPKWMTRFFTWYCNDHLSDAVLGDLLELYERRHAQLGRHRANWFFFWNVLQFIQPFAVKRNSKKRSNQINSYTMLKHFFKVSWRNLFRNKGYSFINIAGLSAGMVVAMLIGLWIWDEFSFDTNFDNRSRLAEVMAHQSAGDISYTGTTVAMAPGIALKEQYGDNFDGVSLASKNGDHVLSYGDKLMSGKGMWVQKDFPEMFTVEMLQGSRGVLVDPSTLLISSSLARAVFGDADPMGKTILLDATTNFAVGGVYEDFPHNSTLYDTRLLLPWESKQNWMNSADVLSSWTNHCGVAYVLLTEQADISQINEQIRELPQPFITGWKEKLLIYPLTKLHLYNEFIDGQGAGGRIQYVWLVGIIGVFVLLLACINFMNLSTARSEKRAKEVGIRKAIGSVRTQLILQFLSESLTITLLAFVLAMIVTQFALPFFNDLADKQVAIPWSNAIFWLVSLSFVVFTGVVSGSYPAFYLSSFQPVKVLKGVMRGGRFASLPRKVLVVIQFTVSVGLIVGTIIVFQQIQYAKNRPVGYSRNALVSVQMNTTDKPGLFAALKNELLQTGAVEQVARSSQSPAHFNNNNSLDWRGKNVESEIFFRNVNVSPDFGKTIGWSIVEGRDFSNELASDSSAALLNEESVKIMGFENPVGEVIKFWDKNYTVIGVVKDMLTQSPYDPMQPAVFLGDGWQGLITMRLNPNLPIREALTAIEPVFKQYNPTAPFEAQFVDEEFNKKFADEERVGSLAAFFAILAIFISCLGLFGLASYVAEQRSKEISIRKVLGASVAMLWKMLSRDFVILVTISCFIAMPLAYYFMSGWLQNYEYHTSIAWYIFALSALGAFAVTLLTVSFQAIRAAVANPVKSLRAE
ncbi:ABC transporter permease [uncultured Imperialibacter sp.]|uniref:ABC transporter permease n=1 Tax=uncultured Imperialibacter sp. TaxID=1672639 RepID=UPI0030DDA2A1|tara:strand:- start:8215 stop:10836 length:2622 start_codon:yes stop_codon:yes gene_type:complete